MSDDLLGTASAAHATSASSPPQGGARWGARILVVAGVLIGLVVLRVTAADPVGLTDAVQDFVTLSISVLIESLPFVVLGIALSVMVQLWVPSDLLFRLLPKTPAVRRAALSVLGVLVPVCECGNVPLARGLLARGVAVPEAMTFLLAAPILNPVTIITTYQAFGWSDGILAWRIVGAFAIANFVGWLFSRHSRPEALLTTRFRASCAATDHGTAERSRGVQALDMFRTETAAMLPALLVGAALAGFIQVALSRDLLLILGQDAVWSVLAMMGLAFIIAICSSVDAFFALSVSSTFLPGAVIAFLVFGPMIDVKMLALLRTTFTGRTLVQLTVVVALLTLVLGLAVNLVA